MHRCLLIATLLTLGSPKTVRLSNTALPVDTTGAPLLTGEATVLFVDHLSLYYLYFNNWGGCPGVDCCLPPANNCATCCFTSAPYSDPCVYTSNHSVVVYSTPDFQSFTYGGVALPPSARLPGVEFRPQVLYNPATLTYVMYYEDRWTSGGSNPGYAVATSPTPTGPFVTLNDSVRPGGKGRIGDYDLFVDPADNRAYHVRTGLTLVRLDANFTGVDPTFAPVEIPNGGEGPALFTREGLYYLLVGKGCCACKGGSDIEVYRATRVSGPYAFLGDVGSNHTAGHTFSPTSQYNYVTKAQQTKVVPVTGPGGGVQYLWMGNQWVTSGGPRNHDLLYFSVLNFTADGNISQLVYSDHCDLEVQG